MLQVMFSQPAVYTVVVLQELYSCVCVLQVMSSQPAVCPAEPLDSEDILFLLYTSGSTGKPKGIVHTQAGYLLYTSLTHQVHTHTRPVEQ